MAYIPRVFTKNVWDPVTETTILHERTAYTAAEEVELLWDGWAPGDPIPAQSSFSPSQREELTSVVTEVLSEDEVVVDAAVAAVGVFSVVTEEQASIATASAVASAASATSAAASASLAETVSESTVTALDADAASDFRVQQDARLAAAIAAAVANTDAGFPQAPHTYDPFHPSSAAAALSASRVSYCRIKGAGTISKILIVVGVQSGNIDVGVYDTVGVGSNARPGNKIASTGSIACPAVGEALVSLTAPVAVRPGYWFAITANNGTITLQRVLGGTYTNAQSFVTVQTGTFPLPATAAPTGGNGNSYLMVGVV